MPGHRHHHKNCCFGSSFIRNIVQFAVWRLLRDLFVAVLIFSRFVMIPQPLYPPLNHPSQINDERKTGLIKIVIITLEFRKGTFSGNGIYAQSIARSLARRGHEVLVISGKQVQNVSTISTNTITNTNLDDQNAPGKESESKAFESCQILDLSKNKDLGIFELEVNVEPEGWGRLDWKCPWKSFANSISVYKEHVLRFNPSWVLVVDWSSVPAFEELWNSVGNPHWRMAFLNFRIYTISEYHGDNGDAEKKFYKDIESKGVTLASAISALSSRDAHILATELGKGIKPGVIPKPHFPPLREDLRTIALATSSITQGQTVDEWLNGRRFFTCCVRISPEKNAKLFASLVEGLVGFLREQQIVPFLCSGANRMGIYADDVILRIKVAMPEAIVYEGFMDATQLSELYSQTLLNIHPCIYDAYGMTIVEAAAFMSPSIVHLGSGGAVGAAEFLDPSKGQVIGLDLAGALSDIVNGIKHTLLNKNHLAEVAWAASKRSLSWDEDANAEQLMAILEGAP